MHNISAKDTKLFNNIAEKPAIYFVQEKTTTSNCDHECSTMDIRHSKNIQESRRH